MHFLSGLRIIPDRLPLLKPGFYSYFTLMRKRKFHLFPSFARLSETSPRFLLTATLLFHITLSYSQTNISGIVNSYYRVIEVVPAKAAVRLASVAGLGYGDRVMLVQMKGASINTSTGSTFGDTTSLNQAGDYEIAEVCYVRGDTVFMIYMLLNTYSVADKVQLVRIPTYAAANVTGTLTASPWNNTAGTGGVLGIYVEGDLILNSSISADSSGYRGGADLLSNGTCSNVVPANQYYYNGNNTAPQSGAYKGEGVVEITAAYSGGRGAPANGGGGGNNHNNGGAGGANLTAGGDGGGNSSSAGCTATRQGKGGKPLSNYGGMKIFMGGGGGAGHVNGGLVPSNGGGHGGGIVFIRADNIIMNGHKISANGQLGGSALSDGASGGGAGGTIIMAVNNYAGSGTIEAMGGSGGTENDGGNLGRCYGAGGGGSGGVIYFSGSTPPVTVTLNGGNAGPEIGRDASCNPAVLPGAGQAGIAVENYDYSNATILHSNYCSQLLPADLLWFRAKATGTKVKLTWSFAEPASVRRFIVERSADGINWVPNAAIDALHSVFAYEYIDPDPLPGINYYRLKVEKADGGYIVSSIQKAVIHASQALHIYPNPTSGRIFITGLRSGGELCLVDLSGKLVFKSVVAASPGVVEVKFPRLPSGVYVVKLGAFVSKLVLR